MTDSIPNAGNLGTTAYERLHAEISKAGKTTETLNNAIEKGNLDNYATVSQLDKKANKTDLTNVFNFKGNVTFSELPTTMNTINDTYYVTDKSANYTWNGTDWYESGSVAAIGNNSISAIKLDTSLQKLLCKTMSYDDTGILKKGVVGSNDVYMINHAFENCTISSITYKTDDTAYGELRIYEEEDGTLKKVKSIDLNTENIGFELVFDLNYVAKKAYIGFTKTRGNVIFGEFNSNYGMITYNDKTAESFLLSDCVTFNQYALPVKVEAISVKPNAVKAQVVVDASGEGDYSTINEAVANYDGTPIFVKNGTYEEQIKCDDKYVVIKGEDKYKTIIKNTYGLYGDGDCLYASKGYFENLTFHAEYVEGKSQEIAEQTGAYGVHVDSNNQIGEQCTFVNCRIISDFNAGVGNGLRGNNIVRFDNCDIISNQDATRGMYRSDGGNGALFTHNNHTSTGDNCTRQVIQLNNCRIQSKLKYVLCIQNVSKTNAEAILDMHNCLVYSETSGVTDVIRYRGFTGLDDKTSVWKIAESNFGNSIALLNAL